MARPLRVELEDAIYQLCAGGNARQAIFHDQGDWPPLSVNRAIARLGNFLADPRACVHLFGLLGPLTKLVTARCVS
jgi:hypothetical protein